MHIVKSSIRFIFYIVVKPFLVLAKVYALIYLSLAKRIMCLRWLCENVWYRDYSDGQNRLYVRADFDKM